MYVMTILIDRVYIASEDDLIVHLTFPTLVDGKRSAIYAGEHAKNRNDDGSHYFVAAINTAVRYKSHTDVPNLPTCISMRRLVRTNPWQYIPWHQQAAMPPPSLASMSRGFRLVLLT